MPVKPVLTTQEYEALPLPLRPAYVERDGKYVIDLEGPPPGFEPKERIDEFRNTNRAAHAKITELEAKLAAFGDIAPDAAQAAIARVQELETQVAGVGEHAKKAEELAAQLARERGEKSALRLQMTVASTARALGFREESHDYLVQRAISAGFQVGDDGKIASASGVDLESWLQDPSFRWCHAPSKGGGSHNAGSGSGSTKPIIDRFDPLAIGTHAAEIARGDVTVS